MKNDEAQVGCTLRLGFFFHHSAFILRFSIRKAHGAAEWKLFLNE